ncbi:MAG: hypothetical protein DRP97_06825, partial [Candidatus Latescibacterota bacterium]
MKISSIIKKNLKLIFKSKFTLFLIILGPLLIMLIVGMVYENKNVLRINIGYYTPQDSEQVDSLVNLLQQNNYSVTAYGSTEACIQELKINKEQICIQFPREIKFEESYTNEIIFHADNSKLHLYESVIDTIDDLFIQEAREISGFYTEDLLARMDYVKDRVQKTRPVLENFSNTLSGFSSELRTLNYEIKKLDITLEKEDVDTSDMDDCIDDISDAAAGLVNYGTSAVNEIIELEDDIDEELDDVADDNNLSSNEFSTVRSRMTTAVNLAEDISSDMDAQYDELEDVLNEITSLKEDIEELNRGIEADEKRIAEVADKRDSLSQDIEALAKQIDESKSYIDMFNEALTLIDTQLEGTLLKDTSVIVEPFKKTTMPLSSRDNQVTFIFPYLVVLVIMFMGLLLASVLIMAEKSSNAIFRNFMTPTNEMVFIIGNYLTLFIILAIQTAVIVGLFAWYFSQDVVTSLGFTILILIGAVSLFTILGMTVAYFMNNEQTSTLVVIAIGSIFLFLSDLISPLEKIPAALADLIYKFNPFVMGSDLLRKSMIYHLSLKEYIQPFALLMMYTLILFCIMFLIVYLKKQQLSLFFVGHRKVQEEKAREEVEKEYNLLHIHSSITKKNGFVTKKGTAISIKGLIELINKMNTKEFNEHISGKHNDFADWIHLKLHNKDLSEKVRK